MSALNKTKRAKRGIVTLKIYFDRARIYLGYINFFILNLVLINSFENEVIKEYLKAYKLILIPLVILVYVSILIFIGYLDTKLGLRQEEMRNNATLNPVMQDLLKTVKEIRETVNNLEKHSKK